MELELLLSAPHDASTENNRKKSSSFESLARTILNLDPSILECNISNDPDGALLANLAKPSLRGMLDLLSRTSSSMGPTWGGVAINSLRRLDEERSPLNYIMISREKFDALLCPAKLQDQALIIGLLLEKNTNASKIYEALKNAIH